MRIGIGILVGVWSLGAGFYLLDFIHGGLAAVGFGALDGGLERFEIGEREAGLESDLERGAGNQVLGGEDEEGGAGLPGEVTEAVP